MGWEGAVFGVGLWGTAGDCWLLTGAEGGLLAVANALASLCCALAVSLLAVAVAILTVSFQYTISWFWEPDKMSGSWHSSVAKAWSLSCSAFSTSIMWP